MCRTGFFKLGCLCLLFGEVVVRWWVCWSRGCIHWERGRDGAGDVGGSSTRKDSDQRDAVRWDVVDGEPRLFRMRLRYAHECLH
jgi:hypothetical protein